MEGSDPIEEASPLLGYRGAGGEEVVEDRSMIWAVRFVGVYVLIRAAMALAWSIHYGLWDVRWLHQLTPLLAIAAGVGLIYRQRWAAIAAVTLVLLAPFRGRLMGYDLRLIEALMLAVELVTHVSFAAIMAYLLWRADRGGALLPRRRIDGSHGEGILLLVRCVGAYFVVVGGMVLVHLAMLPLLPLAGISVGELSFHSVLQIALMLGIAAAGVAVALGRWQLLLLPALLGLAQGVTREYMVAQHTVQPAEVIHVVLYWVPSFVLLAVLYVKARRTIG